MSNRSLIKYKLVIDDFGGWALFQQLLQTLAHIAERHGVALSSVATRWVLEQPQVAAAIVGARYAVHLPQMLEVLLDLVLLVILPLAEPLPAPLLCLSGLNQQTTVANLVGQ